MPAPKMTYSVRTILGAFLTAPENAELYGYQIGQRTGLLSGTLYPVLHRLEECGWLGARKEEPGEQTEGRPPRVYYRLTGKGRENALKALQERKTA